MLADSLDLIRRAKRLITHSRQTIEGSHERIRHSDELVAAAEKKFEADNDR